MMAIKTRIKPWKNLLEHTTRLILTPGTIVHKDQIHGLLRGRKREMRECKETPTFDALEIIYNLTSHI
jgi:hypothetical protein